ncbi:MAG TPA: cupin domain-containing protein [Candidatus Saccharimonadales bacterium]|nr:cupin domain-containing protein [Candidatus Saccharimonadales bacterium]
MIYNTKSTPEIEELISAWQTYISTMGDWQEVVKDTVPKQTYCGPIYEPKSPLNRPKESFAISDMRQVKVAKPHYHTGGETEIYFVLSGSGLTVVGGEELQVKQGDVVVTPPETAHFTIPKENLVMIVINTPPFNPENNIGIDATRPEVTYDHEQYKRLTAYLE